jgi:hypothetical protein
MSKFVRGDARLDAMLADHETRREVDTIVDEMRKIDVLGPDEDGPNPAPPSITP